MEWVKVEAGEYNSKDNRFHIIKTWDKIYNSHWLLYDLEKKEEYPCDSLKDCKEQAKKLVKVEN